MSISRLSFLNRQSLLIQVKRKEARMTDSIVGRPEYLHNCEEEGCEGKNHFGLDQMGLCLQCGGCGDRECCQHEESCFSKKKRAEWDRV